VAADKQSVQRDANALLTDPPSGGPGSTELTVQVHSAGDVTTLDATWDTYTCVDDAGTTICSYTERDVTGATPTSFVFPVSTSLKPPSSASVVADASYSEIQWTCTTTDVSHSCTQGTAGIPGTTHIDLAWVVDGKTTIGSFTGSDGVRYKQRIALAGATGEAFGTTYTAGESAGSSLGTTVPM